MKLNDFVRELTALCKEELNPDITDEFGAKCTQVEYVDGAIMLTFEYDGGDDPEDINFIDLNDGPLDKNRPENGEEPVDLAAIPLNIVPDGDDAA